MWYLRKLYIPFLLLQNEHLKKISVLSKFWKKNSPKPGQGHRKFEKMIPFIKIKTNTNNLWTSFNFPIKLSLPRVSIH